MSWDSRVVPFGRFFRRVSPSFRADNLQGEAAKEVIWEKGVLVIELKFFDTDFS
jgi:hypothetical protein